jgi:hypothetical protein
MSLNPIGLQGLLQGYLFLQQNSDDIAGNYNRLRRQSTAGAGCK